MSLSFNYGSIESVSCILTFHVVFKDLYRLLRLHLNLYDIVTFLVGGLIKIILIFAYKQLLLISIYMQWTDCCKRAGPGVS